MLWKIQNVTFTFVYNVGVYKVYAGSPCSLGPYAGGAPNFLLKWGMK